MIYLIIYNKYFNIKKLKYKCWVRANNWVRSHRNIKIDYWLNWYINRLSRNQNNQRINIIRKYRNISFSNKQDITNKTL